MNKKILISAFGIHSGGGAVLLKALLENFTGNLGSSALDSRLNIDGIKNLPNQIKWVPKSFIARLRSLYTLSKECQKNDTLFCFNSLPPFIRTDGRVVVYVHAPHFVGFHTGISYDLTTRIRFLIERLWFKLGSRYVDEYWVQTESMKIGIRNIYPNTVVKIMPFVDDHLAKTLSEKNTPINIDKIAKATFFYPADGVGHKNHVTLLKAWEILAKKFKYQCPHLLLTLNKKNIDYFYSIADISEAIPYVKNLGKLNRHEVIEQLNISSALIFPSRAETFGLPLLEALVALKPILASERDFVRDVCSPTQTFDPESPRSIARAVERYLGVEKKEFTFLSASEIARDITNSPL